MANTENDQAARAGDGNSLTPDEIQALWSPYAGAAPFSFARKIEAAIAAKQAAIVSDEHLMNFLAPWVIADDPKDRADFLAALRAAHTAAPAGCVWVPIEPTAEMISAWPNNRHGSGHEAAIYRAMLAAAPAAPPATPLAWMYEHDGSLDEPILTVSRWPECHEPWNETPLDALALAKHAIEKVWLDAVGTGHGEHSISEAARARVEFAAEALKLGLRLPGALRNTGVESPTKENS